MLKILLKGIFITANWMYYNLRVPLVEYASEESFSKYFPLMLIEPAFPVTRSTLYYMVPTLWYLNM